jgi:hypothetical protein
VAVHMYSVGQGIRKNFCHNLLSPPSTMATTNRERRG